MQAVFFIIILALGAIYAAITKQGKLALGLLILAISFIFTIPNLVTGVWQDIFGAISMIFFVLGVLVMVFKKIKVVENQEKSQTEEK